MRFWQLTHAYLGAKWRFGRLRGAALTAFVHERACRIVKHAVCHSPFCRSHFTGHDLTDWQSLPTVDKAAMMGSFDTFNTHGIRFEDAMHVALEAERSRDFTPTIRGLTVGLSSGTSGHRGLFLVSPAEQMRWAGTLLARALPSLRWRGYRVAFFLRSNSNLYESLRSRWLEFRYYDLMTPLADAVRALNERPPDVLAGPPSLLGLLADAHERGELRIRPEWLVSVAEVLEPQDEARLLRVFGAPVRQVYQCTEGLLAITCPHGSLHLQEDVVALQFEPVDASDEHRVTPIVTDLWRQAQPIIRYRLSDVLTLASQPCPCGSAYRVIARIEGRCDDLCYLEQMDGGLRPIFPDAIRQMVLLSDGRIEDYQVVQERPGQLRAHLQLPAGEEFTAAAEALRRTVAEIAARHGCRMPVLQIERGLTAQAPGAKRRRVRRR